MPNSPSFLARDRVAYVGSHSFVLLIGALAFLGAVGFFHEPDSPVYKSVAITNGQYFQWAAYILLAVGGICVIVGLVGLYLTVEAAGHTLISTGVLMNGLMQARISSFNFTTVLTELSFVITVICILFRLWALFEAISLNEDSLFFIARRRLGKQ